MACTVAESRYVAAHEHRVAAGVTDAGRDRLAARAVDLGNRHARALAGEELRARAADPGTGAGDDRDLAF